MYVDTSKPFPGHVYGLGSIDQKNKLEERHNDRVVKRKESVTSWESEPHVHVITMLWRNRNRGGRRRQMWRTQPSLRTHAITDMGRERNTERV